MALKPYRVTLTALGPVFVGSGKEYIKKEYVELDKGLVGIADINKIYALAYKKKIARQFEDFMLGRITDKWSKAYDLGQWLKFAKLYDEAAETCIKYTLDMGDTTLTRGQRTQIMACMKDAYGNPYIPGSSLKGALRTIWAAAKIMEDDALRSDLRRELEKNLPITKSRTKYLTDVAESIEKKIFRKLKRKDTRPGDAVNDIMQGFIVGDSVPIDKSALVLAQKVERKTDGTEKNLNLLRESLRPGTKIEFDLTIDDKLCPITIPELLDAIYDFDDMYSEHFLKKFKGIDPLRQDEPQIYLGGGAGFVSKTLIYPTLGAAGVKAVMEIFDKTGVPRKHKHFKDAGLGVSPHIVKCTRYKGKTLQFGLCEFAIEDL